MQKKYILISMEDSRAKKLSKVLGNNTCKKIIDLLTEKESSEKDIADALNVPINTVEYNLKKLMQAELIEKAKNFFWSKKGKRIGIYKLSNKSIIISPKTSRVSSKLKSILPVVLLSGIGAVLIKYFIASKQQFQYFGAETLKASGSIQSAEAPQIGNFFLTQPSPIWIWFLGGALFALLIFTILNWRKL